MNRRKLIARILQGRADNNIPFSSVCSLLRSLGFTEHIEGSHHIFTRDDIVEIINIQPDKGQMKAYQVGQIRKLFKQYGIQ